jgi:signal transduction histidine kinase
MHMLTESPVGDPLGGVGHVAFAEEISSTMRHAARNKLAVIRNAVTYIRRRMGQTEAWTKDPRIEMFCKLAESELEGTADVLAPHELLAHLFVRRVSRVDAEVCLQTAVASARVLQPMANVEVALVRPGVLMADGHEVSLAIRCLIENAVEARPGSTVHLRGDADGARYAFEVADAGPGVLAESLERICEPFFTTKAGHMGLGLNVARRVARRYGGELGLRRAEEGGLAATLWFPSGSEGQP